MVRHTHTPRRATAAPPSSPPSKKKAAATKSPRKSKYQPEAEAAEEEEPKKKKTKQKKSKFIEDEAEEASEDEAEDASEDEGEASEASEDEGEAVASSSDEDAEDDAALAPRVSAVAVLKDKKPKRPKAKLNEEEKQERIRKRHKIFMARVRRDRKVALGIHGKNPDLLQRLPVRASAARRLFKALSPEVRVGEKASKALGRICMCLLRKRVLLPATQRFKVALADDNPGSLKKALEKRLMHRVTGKDIRQAAMAAYAEFDPLLAQRHVENDARMHELRAAADARAMAARQVVEERANRLKEIDYLEWKEETSQHKLTEKEQARYIELKHLVADDNERRNAATLAQRVKSLAKREAELKELQETGIDLAKSKFIDAKVKFEALAKERAKAEKHIKAAAAKLEQLSGEEEKEAKKALAAERREFHELDQKAATAVRILGRAEKRIDTFKAKVPTLQKHITKLEETIVKLKGTLASDRKQLRQVRKIEKERGGDEGGAAAMDVDAE